MELTAEEIRVLGCLIEKQATTPEHSPLSTNALVNACNQKSSREPVTDYSERTVMDAMLLVRHKGLARMNSSGRTDKHRHILDDALGLDRDQLALLAVMMLRGPQSAGELKTRTERYSTSRGAGFEEIGDVEAVLAQLVEGVEPLTANIGRASGQSQDLWAHLLGDVVTDVNRSAICFFGTPSAASLRINAQSSTVIPLQSSSVHFSSVATDHFSSVVDNRHSCDLPSGIRRHASVIRSDRPVRHMVF